MSWETPQSQANGDILSPHHELLQHSSDPRTRIFPNLAHGECFLNPNLLIPLAMILFVKNSPQGRKGQGNLVNQAVLHGDEERKTGYITPLPRGQEDRSKSWVSETG